MSIDGSHSTHRRIAFWKTFFATLVTASLFACSKSDENITAPQIAQASNGSVVVSSVTVMTTSCHKVGPCRTKRETGIARQQVGSARGELHLATDVPILRTSVQSSAAGTARTTQTHNAPRDKVDDDGSTLSSEHQDGNITWAFSARRARHGDNKHFARTDFFQNGQLFVSTEAIWDTVGGVEFVRHRKTAFYASGHLAMQRETTVDPVSVSNGNTRAALLLDPLAPPAPRLDYTDSCPPDIPCEWYNQFGGQVDMLLDGFWDGVTSVMHTVSGWITSWWSHEDVGQIENVAETIMAIQEAAQAPSIFTFFSIVGTAIGNAGNFAVLEALLDYISELLTSIIVALME